MSTWAGAIVENRGRADFVDVCALHGITVEGPVTPWVLVECDVGFSSLHPPAFAESLSRALDGAVIAFFMQTAASVEQLEHWDRGRAVRRLTYSGDEGGWIVREGEPRAWEPVFFFGDGEGVGEGEEWPLNLGDELSDEDLARYQRARAARDAGPVLDLLSGGSVWPLFRVCTHLGVDPKHPGGRYRVQRRSRPWLLLLGVAVLVGALILMMRHPLR
jgi:hypothetical protein